MIQTVRQIDDLLAYDDEIIITLFALLIIILVGLLVYFKFQRTSYLSYTEPSKTNHSDRPTSSSVTSDPDKALIGPFLTRSAKDGDPLTKKTLTKDGPIYNSQVVHDSSAPITITQQKQVLARNSSGNILITGSAKNLDNTPNHLTVQSLKQPVSLGVTQSQPLLPASTIKPLSVRASATQEILLLLPADKSIIPEGSGKGATQVQQHLNPLLKRVNPIKVEMSHLIKMIKD